MDHFLYEIIHTALGSAAARRTRELIANDLDLNDASEPWQQGSRIPASSCLYILIVIVTDDLGADAIIRKRVRDIAKRGFPVLPVVPSVAAYDFDKAPFEALSAANAVELDKPETILAALRHHGSLSRFGTGGQVFISYARKDGDQLAECLRKTFVDAGFRAIVDEKEVPGATPIQSKIRDEIRRSDLVVLIDSKGAARSQWVAKEMDMARAAHVPVLAVTPSKAGFHHSFRTPHVPWETGESVDAVATAAAHFARRLLAQKLTFHDRVKRTLDRICRLRAWELIEDEKHWLVQPKKRAVKVKCIDEEPPAHALHEFRNGLGEGARGILVGGTRPYVREVAEALAKVGGDQAHATPLSRMASKLPTQLAPSSLRGRRIFISAAMPDDDQVEIAALTLAPFVVTFVQAMVGLGATVVFGGHPSVTPLVYEALDGHTADGIPAVELHQAEMWRGDLPAEAEDRSVFGDIQWHGDGKAIETDVAALRDGMIRPGLDGAVFVGGKFHQAVTAKPGIPDEFERFCAACPDRKAFVLGLAEGAALTLVNSPNPSARRVSRIVADELAITSDVDMATALIVAELLDVAP